jgi:hypothetical protein
MLQALQDTERPFFARPEVAGDDAVFCGDCVAPAGVNCDYAGHGTVTLGELMEAYRG